MVECTDLDNIKGKEILNTLANFTMAKEKDKDP